MLLNHDISITTLSVDVRKAFLGDIRKQLLQAGHELYKFTQHPLFKPDGSVTPWWSSVKPIDPRDPGLEQTLERAQNLGVSGQEFARARWAVTRQWNELTNLVRVRLLRPVFGLMGRVASQRYDNAPEFANVVFIGGAWQLYIPNLTRMEVAQIH